MFQYTRMQVLLFGHHISLRQSSSRLRGRLQLLATEEGKTSSEQCPITVKTLKASCLRNFFHQNRPWTGNSIANSVVDCRKTPLANLQKVDENLLRLTSRQKSGSLVALFAAVVGCYEHDSHPKLRTHWTEIVCDFFPFANVRLRLKCRPISAMKWSKSNGRKWWRWSEMSSSSVSDHGNPSEIAVSVQKWLHRRSWRGIETSVSG